MSKRLLVVLAVIVLATAAGFYLVWTPSQEAAEHLTHDAKKAKYQCSMHPQIVSDEPGICPICQMKLQRVDDASMNASMGNANATHDSHTGQEKKATYQCSMHPQIVSNEPGICPICQMKLQRVDDASASAGHGSGERKVMMYRHPMRSDVVSPVPAKDEMGMDYMPVYDDAAGGGPSDVPGHAPFTLSTERQQMIGVTKDTVERRNLDVEIRAVGRVAYDPKLYQAIVEYREAVKSKTGIRESSLREAHIGADALVRGAHLKLRQQGLSDAQIQELTKGNRDPVQLLLPGDSVWVYAQVYEYEAPLVERGQTMIVTAPSQPGRRYVATVAGVDPILDSMTRTVRVRGLVPTPDKSLRPESFVHVTLRIPLGEKLAVPQEAVLDTGEHQIVFVVKGEGSFEPRSVELGRDAEGFYEVLSGLEAGEQVVTSANFLIDSESRFRAALASFKGGAGHKH
jgi:membrane fusion protein, copper/silver efflux system